MEIKISDKWKVTGQPLNYVLMRRQVSKKEHKVSWGVFGYYPTLLGIADWVINENIRDIDGGFNEVIDCINTTREEIITALKGRK